MRGELVSLPGQALAAQTLSIKGREERVGDGSDVLICAFTPDHGEESLPLPGAVCFQWATMDGKFRNSSSIIVAGLRCK